MALDGMTPDDDAASETNIQWTAPTKCFSESRGVAPEERMTARTPGPATGVTQNTRSPATRETACQSGTA